MTVTDGSLPVDWAPTKSMLAPLKSTWPSPRKASLPVKVSMPLAWIVRVPRGEGQRGAGGDVVGAGVGAGAADGRVRRRRWRRCRGW